MTKEPPWKLTVRFAAVGLDHSHIYDQISGPLGEVSQLVGIGSDDPDASIARGVRTGARMRLVRRPGAAAER